EKIADEDRYKKLSDEQLNKISEYFKKSTEHLSKTDSNSKNFSLFLNFLDGYGFKSANFRNKAEIEFNNFSKILLNIRLQQAYKEENAFDFTNAFRKFLSSPSIVLENLDSKSKKYFNYYVNELFENENIKWENNTQLVFNFYSTISCLDEKERESIDLTKFKKFLKKEENSKKLEISALHTLDLFCAFLGSKFKEAEDKKDKKIEFFLPDFSSITQNISGIANLIKEGHIKQLNNIEEKNLIFMEKAVDIYLGTIKEEEKLKYTKVMDNFRLNMKYIREALKSKTKVDVEDSSKTKPTSPKLTLPPKLELPSSYAPSPRDSIAQQTMETTRAFQAKTESLSAETKRLQQAFKKAELTIQRKNELIKDIIRGKKVFDNEDFSEINFRLVLSELNLDGLKGFTFNNCSFNEANFSQIKKITECEFKECKFIEANFSGIEILHCNFSDCNLEKADFQKTQVKSSVFNRCNLKELNIKRGFFKECKFFLCILLGIKTNFSLLRGGPFVGKCEMDQNTKKSIGRDPFLSAQLPVGTTSLGRTLEEEKRKEERTAQKAKEVKKVPENSSKMEKIKISTNSKKMISFLKLHFERGYSQLPLKSINEFGESVSNDLISGTSKDVQTLFLITTSFANNCPISEELKKDFGEINQENLGELSIVHDISSKIIKAMDNQKKHSREELTVMDRARQVRSDESQRFISISCCA
ncbi:MAG: pentapeptide repeat-containing protein, partial [Rickettsiales bacterium]|nr:pentapeptide repeat-containing protein [Rickettsiales bacterium]